MHSNKMSQLSSCMMPLEQVSGTITAKLPWIEYICAICLKAKQIGLFFCASHMIVASYIVPHSY